MKKKIEKRDGYTDLMHGIPVSKFEIIILTLLAIAIIVICILIIADYGEDTSAHLLTRTDLLKMEERESRVKLYEDFLQKEGENVSEGLPYDLLQQMVYDKQSDKQEVYTVSLYAVDSETKDANWIVSFGKTPKLQYKKVTTESQVPDLILNNLNFGYKLITMEGETYLMEVLYDETDLTNWETTYSAFITIKEGAK